MTSFNTCAACLLEGQDRHRACSSWLWMICLVLLSFCCCAHLTAATPLPTMRQQELDLERYLLNLAAASNQNNYLPRYWPEGSGGDLVDAEDVIWAGPVKKNYQHIWRNVQMRMPHYRGNTDSIQSAESKRDMRHTANSLYRLGK